MSISTLPHTLLYVERRTKQLSVSNARLDLFEEIPSSYITFTLNCFNDLTNYAKTKGTNPSAIIVDLDAVKQHQVRAVLHKLATHPKFYSIPFIGITNYPELNKKEDLLDIGLDDCFYGDVNWELIGNSAAFLNEYKKQLLLNKEQVVFNYVYHIPLWKRLFDITIASIILLVASPILLLVALLIKLESKGPILYSSKRIGTGYQEFDFLKFRSMKVNADSELKKMKHLNAYNENAESEDKSVVEATTFVKFRNDPRVTRVGKIIRKTSIDELPQLFNVLRGEMSLIGNRPLPLYEANKMTKDAWAKRFLAPAGLTGLWQVDKRGKDNLSPEQRVDLDVTYAENSSILMDLKILLRTLPAMWQRE